MQWRKGTIMIKVSVIIPVYNTSKYLSQCLNSLLEQRLSNIEIICINDCSSDESLNILEKYAKKDNRIKIINNCLNIGAGKSRDIGIKAAKGEYLSILDSDDFCDQDMLGLVYKACKEDNLDVVIYDYTKYDNQTHKLTDYTLDISFSQYYCKDIFNFETCKDYIFQMFNCGPCTKMYRREFIIENKLEFHDLHNAEDAYFGNMVIVLAKRMKYIEFNKPLYYYRVNVPTQLSLNINRGPRCTWEALMAIKCALVEKDLYKKCKKSFDSYAIQTLYETIESINGNFRTELYQFLFEKGINELGMNDYTNDSFISSYFYNQYLYFKSGEIDAEIILSAYTENNVKRLLESLNRLHYRYALWGVGKFGKNFIEICNKENYKLSGLIDSDIDKHGSNVGGYIVTSFQNMKEHIDAVIITNVKYGKDILNIIRNEHNNIMLVNAYAFCIRDMALEKCIYH